tara:strand:+ start:10178 stop:10657 length:480 start_codon:yes stop_codon:yes gene_type:complete
MSSLQRTPSKEFEREILIQEQFEQMNKKHDNFFKNYAQKHLELTVRYQKYQAHMDSVNQKINETFLNTINNVRNNNLIKLQKEFDFLITQLDATHSEISTLNEKYSKLLEKISENVDNEMKMKEMMKEMKKQKGGKKKTRGKLHRKSYKKKTRRKYQTK